MTTHEPQHSGSEDAATRATNIRRDMYLLFATVYASGHFPLEPDETEDPFSLAQLASEFEEDESRRLLLSIAAAVRATLRGDTGVADLPCGSLTEASGTRPLTVREACDKALHAKTIRLDVEMDGRRAVRLLPTMILDGEARSGEGWTARIELVPFGKHLLGL
jgi:hypothetical protein